MDRQHCFIFEPGVWLGEGKVRLSISDEELKFFTRWKVNKIKKGESIVSVQEIEIKGIEDKLSNQFAFSHFSDEEFKVELENESIGKIIGTGIIRPKLIAWEFRDSDKGFEGFEVYELLENGEYFMHAEYVTKEEFRTHIQGKIWKKAAP